jgi:hypothetical protein
VTSTQLRTPAGAVDALGRPAGGRFASKACPAVYALLDTLTPAPETRTDPERPQRILVAAPRCPHGHFVRWARRTDDKGRPNCPRCHRP